MKLSEMNKYQLYDALCDIVEPLSHLFEDKALEQALAPLKHETDADAYTTALCETLKDHLPGLLQRYRSDVITVLSALTGDAVDAIYYRPDSRIAAELRELVDDAITKVTTLILLFGRDEILAALYRYGPPQSVDMLVSLLRVQNRERRFLFDRLMQLKKEEMNQCESAT